MARTCPTCDDERIVDVYDSPMDLAPVYHENCPTCNSALPKPCSNPACPSQGEPLPPWEFYRNKRTRDGLTSWCRACTIARAKKSYADHGRSTPLNRRPRRLKPETRAIKSILGR